MLHLTTLGALSLERDFGTVAGAALRRRPLALLALVSASPHGLTRDKALAYLWPESDTAHARNCLKQTLFALRRDVAQELFLPGGYTLRIDPRLVDVDRWRFERAVNGGRLREAVDSYVGAFLDGFHVGRLVEFERWVEAERTSLANRFQVALDALRAEAERTGDMMGALRWWRCLAQHDPLSSRVALGLIRTLVAVGDRAEAFRIAESHRRLLEDVFGVLPDTEELLRVEQFRRELAGAGTRRG